MRRYSSVIHLDQKTVKLCFKGSDLSLLLNSVLFMSFMSSLMRLVIFLSIAANKDNLFRAGHKHNKKAKLL